jgi:homoaconitate hydratase
MLSPDSGASSPFTHERIDELVQNRVQADPGATYAKSLYMNLYAVQYCIHQASESPD